VTRAGLITSPCVRSHVLHACWSADRPCHLTYTCCVIHDGTPPMTHSPLPPPCVLASYTVSASCIADGAASAYKFHRPIGKLRRIGLRIRVTDTTRDSVYTASSESYLHRWSSDKQLRYSKLALWSPYGIGQTIIYFHAVVCSLFFLSSFFPRRISAVADWMSAILRHMVWP